MAHSPGTKRSKKRAGILEPFFYWVDARVAGEACRGWRNLYTGPIGSVDWKDRRRYYYGG